MSELLLTIPDAWWLTSNGRYHHQVKAKRTKWIRTYAALAARSAAVDLPKMQAAHVMVHVAYPTARRADPMNAYPTIKAAIDGALVDSGVLPDDDHRHLIGPDVRRETRKCEPGVHTLRLVLTDQHVPF